MTLTQTGEKKTFEALLLLYHPPHTLRKSHKDLLKAIWSLMQGYDGWKVRCFSCKLVKILTDATVHHNDNDEHHNDFSNLSPACYDCNRKEGLYVRRRKKAEVKEREREIAGRAHLPTTAEEIIRHDEGLPLVTRLVIRRIQEGWRELMDWQVRIRNDITLANDEGFKKAIKKLKYGQIGASISNETKISMQTVYHYLFGFKNEWNGWIRVGDFPEGNLVTFVELSNFDFPEQDVYRKVWNQMNGEAPKPESAEKRV